MIVRVQIRLDRDPEAFAPMAQACFRADPFSTSIIATTLAGVLSGARRQPENTRWITVLDAGEVVGVAVHYPPYNPFLPRLPDGASAEIARALLKEDQPLHGVNGRADAAAEFVEAWTAATGGNATPGMSTRMYRLADLEVPLGTPGAARRATQPDLYLAREWFTAFHTEANPDSPVDNVGEMATRVVHSKHLWLWEDDGRPVSSAAMTEPAAGVSRIAPVYTPPEHRRRGYGAAVTARATRACLELGARHVVLYTDLANPTSNSIYQQIGYRPDHDAQEYRFSR